MTADFSRTSTEDALRYRSFFEASEPIALSDLAALVAQSGGPVEQLDGTDASLVSLWQWVVGASVQGFDQLPITEDPSSAVAVGEDGDVEYLRRERLAELLAHYLKVVAGRRLPAARWRVFEAPDGSKDHLHHQLHLDLGDGRSVKLPVVTSGFLKRLTLVDPDSRQPDFLARYVAQYLGGGDGAAGAGSLARLADQGAIPSSDPRRAVPSLASADIEHGGSVGEELHLRSTRGLDPELVAETLDALGARGPAGGPILSAQLDATELSIQLPTGAGIETILDGKRLVGLHVEPSSVSADDWYSLVGALGTLADRTHADFGRAEDIENGIDFP